MQVLSDRIEELAKDNNAQKIIFENCATKDEAQEMMVRLAIYTLCVN